MARFGRGFPIQRRNRQFLTYNIALSEAVADAALTGDSISGSELLGRAVAENAATADVIAGAMVEARTVSDGAATADTVAGSEALHRAVAENAATADGVVATPKGDETVAENAATADGISGGIALGEVVSDSAHTADLISRNESLSRSVSENAASTDGISGAVNLFRSLADSALTTDSVSASTGGRIGESAHTSDSITASVLLFPAVNDTAFTADTILGLTTVSISATATVVVAPSIFAFSTFPPPLPSPGPSGLHDYEVIVTDRYGIAKGQIVSAVPTQIDWVLNDLGQALIDFWILDPTSLILPLGDLPGASEIQIWRDQVLIWWGWPTSATYDAKQVHLTCAGLLFPFSKRSFGPVTTNYLVNPDFELPGGLGVIPGWTAVGVTSGTVGTTPDTAPLLGTQQAELIQATAGVDTYLQQFIPFTSSPIGDNFDVSAWCYISPNATFAPAFGQNGLFVQWIADETVLAGPAIQQITADTGAGQWVRLDVTLEVPPNQTGVLEVRLYAPQGVIYWDACRATIPESVASPLAGADVQFIMSLIVAYANDPTRGKNDNAIPFNGPLTGTTLIRAYQLSDNAGCLDALNEFPTIGICDFEVTWDATGHFRQFQIFPPAKGFIKYNYPFTIDLGTVTDLQGGIDGTKTVTASTVLGQGSSGSSRDIGYAAFPSALGGRVAEDGVFVQGSSIVESATLNFTSADVGQGIYCQQAGVLPIGTTIAAVIDSSHVIITSNQGGGAILTAGPVGIGVGGIILDEVSSALSDLPIGTLQGTAEKNIEAGAQTQFLPTARQRADGPAGLFGNVVPGDVVPTVARYGWLTLDPVLMRVATVTLFPPTEEMECQLNPVPIGSNEYG